jgi:hypothetical protein
VSDEEDKGPKMLRMIRYQSILQDAERMRDPLSQDMNECLSRAMHMGDARTAKQALVEWYKDWREAVRASPHTTSRHWKSLKGCVIEFKAKINGQFTVMSTELGYHSQNVPPDYGKRTYDYASWATPHLLGSMFSDGHELILNGHMGTGKTHLAVLFMEEVLQLKGRKYVVITNIPGIKDKSGRYTDRLRHATRISEVFRIWSDLPLDAQILLVIDEPESNLRGGTSKAVQTYGVFVYMNRKLRISRLEIWHNENEEYAGIRGKKNEQVFRVMKERKDSFSFERVNRGITVKQEVDAVPELHFLEFSTWGMGSITVDVDMAALLRRLEKCVRPEEMKLTVRAALEDASCYLPDLAPEGARTEQKARSEDAARRHADILRQLKAEPERFLGMRGHSYDRAKVRAAFGLTQDETNYLCSLAWDALPKPKKKTQPKPVDPAHVQAILERAQEFLLKRGRGFDRDKIRMELKVSGPVARELARAAWARWKP